MMAKVEVGGSPWASSSSSGLRAADRFFARKGVKCLAMSMGPSVLVWKVRRALAASIWAGDFSGYRIPGTMKASWSWWELGGNFCLQEAEAEAMEDSSGCGG